MTFVPKNISTSSMMSDVTPEVLTGIQHHLKKAKNLRDVEYLLEWVQNPGKWRKPPVSVDTFLDSDEYIGKSVAGKVFPAVRRMAREILEGDYSEAVVVAGIGAGKTTLSEIIACYLTHRLLCLRNPHQYYNLMGDKPITIMNMGTTATQALDNVFAGIKEFMEKSPFFLAHNPRILKGTIKFNKQNILLMSGNSKSTTPLGYNVFCGIMDEAAFYMDSDHNNAAEAIYHGMQKRITSRFGYEGLMVMISSPNYVGDFVMSKLDEAKQPGTKGVFSIQMPTWKSKPIERADLDNRFYFNNRKGLVMDDYPTDFGKVCEVHKEFDALAEIWEIPGEYKRDFLKDPEKSKRDYAAVPSESITGFLPHRDFVREMFTEEESPLQDDGSYQFKELPLRTSYYIHVDLALNKKGKGDFAGFAMAHFDGYVKDEETGEMRKKIVIDLAERIGAGPSGEVEFEGIRRKIYALKKAGFNIKRVSLDGYQSADTFQILKGKGIKAEYLSVDRTIEPYQTFKDLIYTGGVTCHKMPKLLEELCRLEITKNTKIDHPPGGSKDVSDAVCGAVYQSAINAPSAHIGVLAGNYHIKPEPGTASADKQKEEHYKLLHRLADDGLL